jgi:hypothetical protein
VPAGIALIPGRDVAPLFFMASRRRTELLSGCDGFTSSAEYAQTLFDLNSAMSTARNSPVVLSTGRGTNRRAEIHGGTAIPKTGRAYLPLESTLVVHDLFDGETVKFPFDDLGETILSGSRNYFGQKSLSFKTTSPPGGQI